MLNIDIIYKKLASDYSFWLPDFNNCLSPQDEKGLFIQDTDRGYNEYCNCAFDDKFCVINHFSFRFLNYANFLYSL